ELRGQRARRDPSRGRLRGHQDPERRQARRPPRRAAHQVRPGDQPEAGEGAGPDGSAVPPAPRGRSPPVMDRRAFITIVGGSGLAAPLAAEAQQAGTVWRIGLISVTYMRIEDIFFQQLKELGYVEGQNLVVERRYSEGRAERFPEFAAALARLSLDIIVVTTTTAALAVKNATRTIPIVQPNSIDPVGAGLVASLA